MSLGLRLKNIREIRNLSQKEVGNKIGVSNAVISNYETGRRDPDTDSLKNLAIAYDVSTDYLLGLIDIPTRLSDKDKEFLKNINDENLQIWWEELPLNDVGKLNTLKKMWNILNAEED